MLLGGGICHHRVMVGEGKHARSPGGAWNKAVNPLPKKRVLFLIVFGLVCSLNAAASSAEHNAKVLIFGLLPSQSPIAKFKRYAPLRDYLAHKLGRRILLETAPNFREFVHRTEQRRYDLLETAPHYVPLAVDGGSYQLLTTIVQPLSAKIVVRADSPFHKLADLKGAVVATPAPEAIITMVGMNRLSAAGLAPPAAIHYENFRTHNAAYHAVLGGQAQAAIIAVNILNKARQSGAALRVIDSSRPFPNMAILASTKLPESLRTELRRDLINMTDDPEGRKVLAHTAYPGYRAADVAEFEPLRRYAVPPQGGH